MQQLTAFDAQFLGLETPECPLNMGLLIMLEGPSSEDSIRELLTQLKIGALRNERHHQRLWYSHLIHDYPYWLNDGRMDVEKHITHHVLESPGNTRQLHALAEKLFPRPMDRTEPLWEFHLIDGLENGQHALILKLHHACADGLNAVKMFARTVEETGSVEPIWPPRPTPGVAEGLWLSLKGLLQHPIRLLYNLVAISLVWLFLQLYRGKPSGKRAPQASRFTGPISGRRSYATLDISLKDIRRINRRYGSSENEVLMSIYSGALRRYLLEKGELPERSMHANMPISTMFSESQETAANQANITRVTLGTRIDDPVKRLEAMKQRCARALKRQLPPKWERAKILWLNASVRLVDLAARAGLRLMNSGRILATASAITTYMPGPVRQVSVAGYRILAAYPMNIIYHGIGLSISAMRYAGNAHIGIAADARMLPDPEKLGAYIQSEFDALLERANAA